MANGNILHDWHAEVLAMRAFNRYLLEECVRLGSNPEANSDVLLRRSGTSAEAIVAHQPFDIDPSVKLFMYCSEAPCGDASIELVMSRHEDTTPWPVSGSGNRANQLLGLSLLSGLTSRLIAPGNAYIDTLVLPKSQHAPEACERAFGSKGRMKPLFRRQWSGGYAFRSFSVAVNEVDFQFSQQEALRRSKTLKGSNISAVWTPNANETLVNGVLQGRATGL